MIVKLKFDMFYTTIKVPNISEKELRNGFYDKFYRWLKMQHCTEKIGGRIGYVFADDEVIDWLKETKFPNDKIEILEKGMILDYNSNYNIDVTLFF